MTGKEIQTLLGKNVKTNRKRIGLSQEALSEKVGVTKNTISDIETGNSFIGSDILGALAAALNIDVYELFKPENVLPDNPELFLYIMSEDIREDIMEVLERKMDEYRKNREQLFNNEESLKLNNQ